MKAILIRQMKHGDVGGTPIISEEVKEVHPKGKDFSLEELRALLECDYVEHLDLAKGVHLWVDEEGRLKDRPLINLKATQYFRKAFPPEQYLYPGGVSDIVGNAIIVDNTKAGWL